MLLAGVSLALVAGPPRLPSAPLQPEALLRWLGGTRLPLEPIALLLVDLAWAVWAWATLSLLLELLLVVAELLALGHGWVRALRQFADRTSVPLVRRAVAAAFAVQVISRGVPIAAAQTLPPPETIVVANAPSNVASSPASRPEYDADPVPSYLVRPGDTLWSIAEQAYGSGAEYRRLVDANVGRSMADGTVFSALGVIQPGWRLRAPGATWDVDVVDGQRWYTVRQGDTLTSIAAALLGDGARWNELFELNRGASSADGAHSLVDPNTIWPGLRLQLPESTDLAAPDAESLPAEEPAQTELLVASAPQLEPDTARPVVAASVEPPPAPKEQAPLLRTPHVQQPVVLDPQDAASDTQPEPQSEPISATPAADAEVSISPQPWQTPVPGLPFALGGLGLAGVAGLAFGARRIRRLRPLPQEPENEVVVQGGFAEAQLAHDLTRGLHGVGFDPLAALVAEMEHFLAEHGLDNVEVVAVRHGRSSTSLTLRCGLAEQSTLVDLAPAFAAELEAEVEACVTADQDVLLRLTRLRKTRLLPTAEALQASPCLVPLGVLYDRQVYAAAWPSLGHVLVVSLPGHGADTILTSLLATVTARRSPDQLEVWLVAAPRSLPAPLFELPHLAHVIDPADSEALSRALDHLRAELDRRADEDKSESVSDLLVVVPELAAIGEQATSLALLAERAADLGVKFVVASSDPEAAATSPLSTCFETRMVLRMQSEEASVALLGVADAAFLGGGGRLLLRLDGREAVELYGYQVAAEHLERLVKVMRSAYAAPPARGRVDEPPQPPPAAPAPQDSASDDSASPTGPIDSDSPAPAQAEPIVAEQPRTPVIQIFCFGSPRVMCAGEVVWPRGSGDAKPWELMLFLACQPSEGVSRDAVVEAMWPEDDSMVEGAPHRFRQLRYRLRRQLQEVPHAPQSDGVCFDRRNLRLDSEVACSDAHEFLNLVRAARLSPESTEVITCLERAREVYTGDLLEGPDARRYAWVDERGESGVTLREHFRRLFQNASVRLAEAYAASGMLEASIELYRELTEMDPADERLWQALFRLHAQRRDLDELVAEEQRMRRTLRELAAEFDASDGHADEPGRDTVDEYQRLLAGLRERQPAAV
jgi:DNA-binding SARP family transcriptional activator/nucleoid-associated protein YgaU